MNLVIDNARDQQITGEIYFRNATRHRETRTNRGNALIFYQKISVTRLTFIDQARVPQAKGRHDVRRWQSQWRIPEVASHGCIRAFRFASRFG